MFSSLTSFNCKGNRGTFCSSFAHLLPASFPRSSISLIVSSSASWILACSCIYLQCQTLSNRDHSSGLNPSAPFRICLHIWSQTQQSIFTKTTCKSFWTNFKTMFENRLSSFWRPASFPLQEHSLNTEFKYKEKVNYLNFFFDEPKIDSKHTHDSSTNRCFQNCSAVCLEESQNDK